jgi:hypothetical protein
MARTRTVYLCLRPPFRTWFCVKTNGSLQIVHDPPAPLMQSSSAMPQVLPFVEAMAARACCSMPNPFVGGNDHSVHVLDISSRDLTATSFLPTPSSAPFGAPFFPKVGLICQFAIFHSDRYLHPRARNPPMLPPASRYVTPGMVGYEMIPENPGIRHFIWKQLNDIHSVMRQLGHVGTTVSAPKLLIATPGVTRDSSHVIICRRDVGNIRIRARSKPRVVIRRYREIRDVIKP